MVNMTKRILCIEMQKCNYDVLLLFLKEIYMEFERQGYFVDKFIIDSSHSLKELIRKPFYSYEFVFSINSALIEKIAFYLPATIPVVAFLVDHPIDHDSRLRNAIPTFLVTNVGEFRVQYAKEIYKNINRNAFIPHGGSKGKVDVPYKKRSYNVVLFGGYQKPEDVMAQIHSLGEDSSNFNFQLIKEMLSDETVSFMEAVKQVALANGEELSGEDLRKRCLQGSLADQFFRAYCREYIIRALVENGIDVDVFGNGWEQFNTAHNEHLKIHSPLSYSDVLNLMGDTKIVLNITPTLNAGAHERIFSAMLNGALCLTNYSSFLEKTGLGDYVISYSIHGMDEIPQMVQMLLDSEEAAENIAKQAQIIAMENHTWAKRAVDIIKFVENYKKDLRYTWQRYYDKTELDFREFQTFCVSNSKEILFEKMKCCLNLFLEDNDGRRKHIMDSYMKRGFWTDYINIGDSNQVLRKRCDILKDHMNELDWMYSHLGDCLSKKTLYSILRYWMDYTVYPLSEVKETNNDFPYAEDILVYAQDMVAVDINADTGTFAAYLANFLGYKKIYCFNHLDEIHNECQKNMRSFDDIECCWYDDELIFLDKAISDKISILRICVNGRETEVIQKAHKHIQEEHPQMIISLEGNDRNLWEVAMNIYKLDDSYKFYMRYYGGILYPNNYVLYAV